MYSILRRLTGILVAVCISFVLPPMARGEDVPPPVPLQSWQEAGVRAALEDPAETVRRAAVIWLGNKETRQVQLLGMVADYLQPVQPPEVKAAAAQLLGRAGASAARYAPQLAALLKDPRKEVREAAAEALSQMGPTASAVAPQLAAALEDADWRVQGAAVTALGQMGPAALPFADKLFVTLATVQKQAAAAFIRLGSVQAVDISRLVTILTNPDANGRIIAAEDLGYLAPLGPAVTATAPKLAVLLKDDHARVRSAAAEALASMGPAGAAFAPQIAALLENADPDVRGGAARALGTMGPAAAVYAPRIAALLKDQTGFVRDRAAQALGHLGAAAAAQLPGVVKLLADPDPDVRKTAVNTLDFMRSGAAYAPQIAALIRDHELQVSQAAGDALSDMGPAAGAMAPGIADLLQDPESRVQNAAIETLGKMGPAAATAAPRIAAMLQDSNSSDQALRALAAIGAPAASAASQVAALLGSPGTAAQAANTLGKMGPLAAAAAPQLAPLLKAASTYDRSAAAEALGRMGAAARAFAPQLADLLKDPDADVRGAAAKALGGMGAAAAPVASRLGAAMADPAGFSYNAQSVGSAVIEALDRIAGAAPLKDRSILFECLEAAHARRAGEDFLLRAYVYRKNSPGDLQLIRWLGSRKSTDRPAVASLDREAALALLKTFGEAWDVTAAFPQVRQELAEGIAELAPSHEWQVRDLPALEGLYVRLAPRAPTQALAVRAAIDKNNWARWVQASASLIGAHFAAWVLLIFAYPRAPWVQSFFFWNKWARRFLGAGYVGVLIAVVPWLRRRMFLPFRESLLPHAQLEQLSEATYFPESEVLLERSRRIEAKRLPLTQALADIRGQVVLKGQSGLGKTLLLLRLAMAAKDPVVFLRATECAHGVLAAIQRKLHGQLRDAAYLRKLIHAGALKVLIDGLNEASPDARARITQFVEAYFKGGFILTTQPIGWEPPATARIYVLQPLQPGQIGPFLLKQWEGVQSRATLSRGEYEAAVQAYAGSLSGGAPADPRLAVLSNPMDATLAAELVARGETPDVFGLIEQRYRLTSADFREREGRDFPRLRFAEAVYEWKVSGEPDLHTEGFEPEVAALVRDRLMLQRTELAGKDRQEIRRWFFRHDKIMEFFLLPAFMNDRARRERHFLEERFWGVYELLAVRLPDEEEKRLQQFLVGQAALTGRSEMLNRYTLARRARALSWQSPSRLAAFS